MSLSTTRAHARRVELILERLTSLPTLSSVAQKLMSAGSHDDIDIQELARLIEGDPSLTGKVLSMCRGADKGLGDKITDVQRAITLLGLDAVTSAVLSVEVYEILNKSQQSKGGGGFDATGHWRHAIAVAAGAELLCAARFGRSSEKHEKPETAFVAGLLHSIGRIALEIVLPDAYHKVLSVAAQRGADSASLEREIIGIDHLTAGKRLAEHWGLPKMLRDVVWLHATPVISLPGVPHKDLIASVAVSKALCRRLNLGWSGDFADPTDVTEACVAAEFDPEQIDRITIDMADAVAARSQTLGLDEVSGTELMLESVLRANARLAQLNHTLSSRSAHSEQQRGVLKAITGFTQSAARGGLTETLSAAACSARSLVGGLFAGVVIQPADGEPWQALRFDADGRLEHSAVEPGPESADGTPLRLCDVLEGGNAPPSSRQAILPWISEHLTEGGGLAGLRVIGLPSLGDIDGGAAMLVVDDDFKRAVPSEVQRTTLLTTWAGAIGWALKSDAVDRLANELTERHAELASAQARLAESRSMAHLGEMTAGAAHELNNPLTVIKGYGQILRREAKESSVREPAEKIAEAAQRLSDLITGLHLLADPPEPKITRTVVNEVLNEALGLAKARSASAFSARLVIPDMTPMIRSDKDLLARALAELITNAAESESAEIIEVRVQTDPLDDRLMVVVKDRGRGMDEPTLTHAFDPFFSAKPAGRAQGLGLCRARRLVELMGGTITLASEDGEGTTATVTLPGWRVDPDEQRPGALVA